jgi:hypothetical protein
MFGRKHDPITVDMTNVPDVIKRIDLQMLFVDFRVFCRTEMGLHDLHYMLPDDEWFIHEFTARLPGLQKAWGNSMYVRQRNDCDNMAAFATAAAKSSARVTRVIANAIHNQSTPKAAGLTIFDFAYRPKDAERDDDGHMITMAITRTMGNRAMLRFLEPNGCEIIDLNPEDVQCDFLYG